MTVSGSQRHTRQHPCPVCGGHDGMPRGKEKRCNGYTSEDGKWCICSRVSEGAHHTVETATGTCFAHLLRDEPLEQAGSFTQNGGAGAPREVAVYDYHDEAGKVVYQVVRLEPKTFRMRHPDGKTMGMPAGQARVMYRRCNVSAHEGVVYLCEGEKDADAVEELGLVATTSAGGAASWRLTADDGKKLLAGRDVCIVAHKDAPGHSFAEGWRGELDGVAASVRVVQAEKGKDAAEWIEQGATAEDFARVYQTAKPAEAPLLFQWVGVRDIEKPLPDVPYVCRGLRLSPGAVTLWAGYGYSGKTLAAQALLVAVAAGVPVWGMWETEVGCVGHLDYEQGPYLCMERAQRLARGMNVSLSALAHDRYRLVSLPSSYVTGDVYSHLCRAFEGCKSVLVDSFRAACPGVDENSSDARIPLDVLSRVGHSIGAAMNVIHHARKTNEDETPDPKMVIRGSSAIFDAAQSAYVLMGRANCPSLVHHVKDRFRGVVLPTFGLSFADPTPDAVVVRHVDQEELERIDFAPELEKFDRRTKAILEAVRAGADTANGVWRRVRGDRNATLKRVKEMLADRELAFVDGHLRVV